MFYRRHWKNITAGAYRFPHVCPDFVIELLSSSDRLAKAQAKME
jgi:Uma2 family endonuclease